MQAKTGNPRPAGHSSCESPRSYQLLVDTWQRAANDPDSNYHYLKQYCAFYAFNFEASEEEWELIYRDHDYMKGTWRLMLAYFLTDHRYIFE